MKTNSVLPKLLLASCIVSVLVACGNNTSNVEASANATASVGTATLAANVALQHMAVDSFRPPASTDALESPVKPRDVLFAPMPASISLGVPPASQSAAMQKSNEEAAAASTSGSLMAKPLLVGFGRDVAQTSTASATQQVLKWQTTASGGQVAAINFVSTGAKGMRLGLLVTQLPETATLRYYAKGATTAFEVKGADVLKVLATNLAAGDKSDAGRTYWAPSVDAADATLEIELPMGISSSMVKVAVPQVVHMTMSTNDTDELPAISTMATGTDGTKTDMACQVDVTCEQTLPAASNAVARLYFIFLTPGGWLGGLCSGTLLNDSVRSGTPYLLTANHCIATQTMASNLESKFQYRSTVCNIATNYTYFKTTPNGAKLLYTAYSTDSTLLQLDGKPASPTPLYAGWDATAGPALQTAVTNIHHPGGNQQRISRGVVTEYAFRNATQNTFDYSNIADGNFLRVTLTNGLTEGGSSGSGLFKGPDSNPQVIGQLWGGSQAICGSPKYNLYGSFNVGFNAGMKDFLAKENKVVTLFNNGTNGVYFYTSSTPDFNTFLVSNPTYSNKGTSFKASNYQTAGLSPVYRFYNTSNGSYFYTISEKERAAVASNTPRMRYDGVVWYASATAAAVAGTVPLYSAFNKATGAQFFTTSLSARSSLIAANPQFITDGVAFYVAP